MSVHRPVGFEFADDTDVIIFNRQTRTCKTLGTRAKLHVTATKAASGILSNINYLGISRVSALLNRFLPLDGQTVILDKQIPFRFPAGDYYWSRLLDTNYTYEPEIDLFLEYCSDIPWTFVDAGANFGYWSTKVALNQYGHHEVIAIEASSFNCRVLEQNLRLAPREHTVHHRILDSSSGKVQKLYGRRHAGFSTDPSWLGSSDAFVEETQTISVDDIYASAVKTDPEKSLIFKLDVEGSELKALEGATNAVTGTSLFIMEDAEKGMPSSATAYAIEKLGMRIFFFEKGIWMEVRDLAEVRLIKENRKSRQQVGLNLFLTKSEAWIALLKSI
jgi:FkbM family methyltransferase